MAADNKQSGGTSAYVGGAALGAATTTTLAAQATSRYGVLARAKDDLGSFVQRISSAKGAEKEADVLLGRVVAFAKNISDADIDALKHHLSDAGVAEDSGCMEFVNWLKDFTKKVGTEESIPAEIKSEVVSKLTDIGKMIKESPLAKHIKPSIIASIPGGKNTIIGASALAGAAAGWAVIDGLFNHIAGQSPAATSHVDRLNSHAASHETGKGV